MQFQQLDNDQRREMVNSRQRFEGFRAAVKRADGYRGSMVFSETAGTDYLLRSYYDPKTGLRRQKSLGRRSAETEALKASFDAGRSEAEANLDAARAAIERQAAINRALGLGRVPDPGARILRALDAAGLLGNGLRVVGTNALFAYESAAGIRFPVEVTTTEDIDILFDARARLAFSVEEDQDGRSLLGLLKKVDRSFARTSAEFRARNRDGYLVDLIRPMRDPPWTAEPISLAAHGGATDADDLAAVGIEGLNWQENAPPFEAMAIDQRGYPTRIVASDPRAFAVHKLWLSARPDRAPEQQARDLAQARAVGQLVAQRMPHLPFEPRLLKHFPKRLVDDAAQLFAAKPDSGFTW
jgi:hypothetical protein